MAGTKRVIGIDASFSTIGLAVIDYNEDQFKLIHKEYYKPPSEGNLFERLAKVREYIISKLKKYKPNSVVLEDIVKYMRFKSNAHTVTLLAALNRTVGLAVYNTTGKPPYLFSAIDIRNTIKTGEELPPKEDIPELVYELLDEDFEYLLGARGAIKEENFDMADAIACALSFVYMDAQGDKIPYEPVVKKKARRKKRRAKRKTKRKRKKTAVRKR